MIERCVCGGEAIRHLEAVCKLYCTYLSWYDHDTPPMLAETMAYEMVSAIRQALPGCRDAVRREREARKILEAVASPCFMHTPSLQMDIVAWLEEGEQG